MPETCQRWTAGGWDRLAVGGQASSRAAEGWDRPEAACLPRQSPLATGKWYSYYDGATWTKASDVDIDHMVPLKEAWKSGARLWSGGSRNAVSGE
jgi:hypothetical protein